MRYMPIRHPVIASGANLSFLRLRTFGVFRGSYIYMEANSDLFGTMNAEKSKDDGSHLYSAIRHVSLRLVLNGVHGS